MKIKDIKVNIDGKKLNTEYENYTSYGIYYDNPEEVLSHHIKAILKLVDYNNNFTPNEAKSVLQRCIEIYTDDMANKTGGYNLNFDGLTPNRDLNIDELEIKI